MRTKAPLQAEKILTAAARLFATHRFHEARMEDVAALAEVGKGTLYRYFKDKEELYTALLERAGEHLACRLREEVGQAGSPRARLVALVAALVGYFDENPHLMDLIQHAEVMQGPNRGFPWGKTREETMALTRAILDAGSAAGDFVVEDRELAMLMLLGGLRGVVRFSQPPRAPDVAERIVDGFLAGYARVVDEDGGRVVRKGRLAPQASAG